MELTCPLMKKPCIERMCRWWIALKGENPQGGVIDQWGCAIEFLPILLIENSKQTRGCTQSVEDFKKAFNQGTQLLLSEAQARRLEK